MAERTDVATRMRPTGETPERSAEAIRQDIAAKRESISETVDKLGERIQETLDWRQYVADYPFIALGAAAGIGLLASAIFKPNPTPRERMMDALAESIEDLTDRFRGVVEEVTEQRSGARRMIRTAATATLSKYAMDFLQKKFTEMSRSARR